MYLTYAYMTAAYLQVVAPSSLAYTAETVTATKGQAIAQNSPSYSGEAVTSWSISPALPAGLSFNTMTGVISGTPTALATQATYTVTAANAGGSTTKGLKFTVIDVAPSALSYTYATQTYTKGTAITTNSPSSAGGAVVSYSISPALPAGLSLDTSTGRITGTPTTLSTAASYTVTATNTGGSTTASVSITVNDVAPSALSYAASPFVLIKGSLLSGASPTVSGGLVVSYSVSPSLPTGLSLNASTGVISGTASVLSQQASYTVTATNSGGSTSAAFDLTINDISPSNLVYAGTPFILTNGQAMTSATPTVGGGAVTAYSIWPTLPEGLTFNTATGVISGTPSGLSTASNYIILASNSGGSTQATINLRVNDVAPSALTYAFGNAVYTKGSPITLNTPTASGGSIVSYSIAPDLPSGLTLNTSTGAISGTPTGLYGFSEWTVTATNTGGSTTASVFITVNDAAPASLVYPGSPYVFLRNGAIAPRSPSVSGGVVVSYSVSPSLPAGLALNTATGVLSGTPTAVAASAFYTVTASNSGGSTTFNMSLAVSDASPIIAVPPAYVSGSKATLTLNRASLSALSKVQQHPVLSEQAQWAKVQAVYENTNIAYGDTDRIVGVRFRGSVTMSGKFKADAESGDTYRMKGVYISGAGHRLKISRDDLETPSVLDFTVS